MTWTRCSASVPLRRTTTRTPFLLKSIQERRSRAFPPDYRYSSILVKLVIFAVHIKTALKIIMRYTVTGRPTFTSSQNIANYVRLNRSSSGIATKATLKNYWLIDWILVIGNRHKYTIIMVTVQVANLSHENLKLSRIMRWCRRSRLSSHFSAKSIKSWTQTQVTLRSSPQTPSYTPLSGLK